MPQLSASESGQTQRQQQPDTEKGSSTCDNHKADSTSAAAQLCTDPGVLLYLRQLDEHRRKCELSGRYAEAAAAAARIKELHAAEAERLRGTLLETQHAELRHLKSGFQEESQRFDAAWMANVAEFESGVASQLTSLKSAHEAQLTELLLRCEAKRPNKPQHSAEILNARRMEEALVKQGQYRKAHDVKVSTDALYASELAATQHAWDLDVELKRGKLEAKQQGEVEAFLARAARGRNELELRRLDEAQKRQNRFRALVQELDGMHRLETLHLLAFLDSSHSSVTPYVPLRNTNFKRKRELLGL